MSFLFTTVLPNRTVTFALCLSQPFLTSRQNHSSSFSSSSSSILFPLSLYLCNSIETWNFSLKVCYYSSSVLYCYCFRHPSRCILSFFFLTSFKRKLPFSFSLIFIFLMSSSLKSGEKTYICFVLLQTYVP